MRLGRLLLISRPLGWVIMPLIFICGLYLGPGLGLLRDPVVIFQLLALAIPLSMMGYGINDIYDIRSDKLNRRKGKIWGAVLEPSEIPAVWIAVGVSILILAVSALLTRNPLNMIIMAILILFGVFYSLPPVRLKERPPLDAIADGVICCYGPFFLAYSLGAWDLAVVQKVLIGGLAVMAVHMYFSIPDYTPDRLAGQKTFAVKYGVRATALIAAGLMLCVLLFSGISTALLRLYIAITFAIMLATAFVAIDKMGTAAYYGWRTIFLGYIIIAAMVLI